MINSESFDSNIPDADEAPISSLESSPYFFNIVTHRPSMVSRYLLLLKVIIEFQGRSARGSVKIRVQTLFFKVFSKS